MIFTSTSAEALRHGFNTKHTEQVSKGQAMYKNMTNELLKPSPRAQKHAERTEQTLIFRRGKRSWRGGASAPLRALARTEQIGVAAGELFDQPDIAVDRGDVLVKVAGQRLECFQRLGARAVTDGIGDDLRLGGGQVQPVDQFKIVDGHGGPPFVVVCGLAVPPPTAGAARGSAAWNEGRTLRVYPA